MAHLQRRYDIDWLRVITIGLLLIYHIAIVFQPWGIFIGFIQSSDSWESLWIPMSILNIWRIPLLFFVSGMGVCFAIKKRNWKELLTERSKRILLPFIFGVLLIVPLHFLIWQNYYKQDLSYSLNPSHLWFLANIFIYVLALSPLFFYLKKHVDGRLMKGFMKLIEKPIGLLLVLLPFVIEVLLVKPETFEMYAMTWHGFFLGGLAFLFGFCFVLAGSAFWQNLLKWRGLYLLIALSLYAVRLYAFELKSPNYLMAVESNVWIFAVMGYAYRYLNQPSELLRYLSEGAYPIYILHMFFLFLGSSLILPLHLPMPVKFVLIVLFTFAACFVLYDLVIRRVNFLRPVFGLKGKRQSRVICKNEEGVYVKV
ncbi:acyltransferase family protein [Ancylomarina sp. YFZ004]